MCYKGKSYHFCCTALYARSLHQNLGVRVLLARPSPITVQLDPVGGQGVQGQAAVLSGVKLGLQKPCLTILGLDHDYTR